MKYALPGFNLPIAAFRKNLWIPALLLIAFSLFSGLDAQSQGNMGLSFPSVNNSFLGTAGLAQPGSLVNVDQFTGTAQVQVPIGNLPSLDLSIPVSVGYVGGRGIRLQDYPGQVGLGWMLNAGGNVSRVVRGYPDEGPNGYTGTAQWGKKVVNYYLNGATLDPGLYATPPTGDGEPDLFDVKTPFFDVQFTLDENGNAVTSNNTGLQIIGNNMYNTGIYPNSSFEVIDDKGNQYYFGSTPASVEETYSKIYGTLYYFPTTWYLDKIISFNSKDVITISYIGASNNDTTYHYSAMATADAYGATAMDSTHPIMNIVSVNKYVSAIRSSLGEADFSYSFDRRDDPNAGRLSTITFKGYNPQTLSNSTNLETFTFNYSYFGDPTTDPNQLRLRLDNIGLVGNNPQVASLNFKAFTYNTTNNLQSRKYFGEQDYFGYYNYNPNITNHAFPNNSRAQYLPAASANVLTGITDITGGTWHLSYELNDYYNGTANTPGCGLRVSQLSQTLPTGENIFTNYTYIDPAGHSTGQVFSQSYLIGVIVTDVYVSGSLADIVYQYLSESPADFYDLNGTFNSYSSVRSTAQNGGYTISQFSNFSNFPDLISYIAGFDPNSLPDVTSSVSRAYKRGLLLDQATYTAANNKITEDIAPLTSYVSLTSPVVPKSLAYKYDNLSYSINGFSGYSTFGSAYWTNVENFLPTGTIHNDFDQSTAANFLQKTSTFTYAPDKRQIRSVSTANSKGMACGKTFYYSNDIGIPMITTPEQTTLTAAIAPGSNAVGLLIHEIDSCTGSITQVHKSFGNFPYGPGSRILMQSSKTYQGSTFVQQQLFQYDVASSALVSSSILNGKAVSTQFGYNGNYPVAKVVNANNVYNYTNQVQTQSTVLNIPAGGFGTQLLNFTSYYSGTITLTITPGSYLAGGVICSYAYSLTGPVNQFGNLCLSSASGFTCPVSNTVSFTGMPPGTYQLLVNDNNNTATTPVPFTVTYQGMLTTPSPVSEFFYEGFEENSLATGGSAHTGNRYWNTNYTTSFVIPNTRSYVIQWWNLSGGKWLFNEQPYTGLTTLTGPVDDIRIFPSDALMTTYTYQPIVGQTSEIKPSGQMITQEYDYLNRLRTVRDQDGNILRKICYNYAGAPASCALFYNPLMSQLFSKSCPVGQVGSQVAYAVPANTYFSDINQGNANQQAQDDITANGPNYANAHGTCSCGPSFNFAAGITGIIHNQISASGTTVSFSLVFAYPSGQTSFSLGNVIGNCAFPTSTRTIPYPTGSSLYDIIISATGNITIQWISGPVLSGTVAFVSSYDINLNAFYSAAASGNFTKACTSPQIGSSVTYSVPQYKYSSTTSQPAADLLATNDVAANGQTFANNNGTCSTPCSFAWNSGITNHLSNTITSSAGTVSFNLTFVAPSNGYTGGTIGTITGGCLPSGTRSVSVTDGANSARHWTVTILSSGVVSISFVSGPATTNTYPPIVLVGSFSL